jgi:hypothetical protein
MEPKEAIIWGLLVMTLGLSLFNFMQIHKHEKWMAGYDVIHQVLLCKTGVMKCDIATTMEPKSAQ